MDYASFLQQKRRAWAGASIAHNGLPSKLFDWQAAITSWALKKGRAAIWADCGLGKSFMQLAWAEQVPGRVLILAPLCVAEQTVAEGLKLGLQVEYAPDGSSTQNRLVVTNYERLEKFDAADFAGVVLDESSILKAFDGKTKQRLIDMFAKTPYRLCCTATPSPNDIAELANHAEFLGLMTRAEFLATWFVHDDQGWRMKGHATGPFYRWLSSWALALRKPSDIGYSDAGFALPPLHIRDHIVAGGDHGGALFPELGLKGIQGRLSARRASVEDRCAAVASMVTTGRTGFPETSCAWVCWCGLNDESDMLAEMIPDAVNIQGSDSYAVKRQAVMDFTAGKIRVLVSKLKILGFGMNFQHCHHMAFVGLSDSYESYYQGIRRCWRFGQKHPVNAHIVVSDSERAIVSNVRRKEADADALSTALLTHMRDFEREELEA